MALYSLIASMGGGKTLWAVIYAKLWSLKHPDGHIWANFTINLKNAHYTPLMFMSFETLKDCLIIIDDFRALKNFSRFSILITNISRKKNIEVILTAQYNKHIPLEMRTLTDGKIVPSFSRKSGNLFFKIIRKNKPTIKMYIPRAVSTSKAHKLYDTNEIVAIPVPSLIRKELLRISQNKRDLEINLYYFIGSEVKREKLFKKLCEKKGWIDIKKQDKQDKQQQNWYMLYVLNKRFNVSFKDLSLKYKIDKTKIFNRVKEIDYYIKENNLDIIKDKDQ